MGSRALWYSGESLIAWEKIKAMEIFRLDKAIDNENLDLEMAIAQLKKEKQQLS